MRRLTHCAMACIGIAAATMHAGSAVAEVLFRNASVEISGSGVRNFRSCTVILIPTQTLGDALSPRLTLITSGLSRLSLGVENADKYQDPVVVQDNVRRSLSASANVTFEQFLSTDLAKALKSQRLFFVTTKRSDTGKFVSSRYDRLDFDAILGKVEANCPFDAESLMSDLSARERTERSLAVSQSDLKLIRWALNKKYGNASSSEPEARPALSPVERNYLKRYGADNGLPASQYLTAEVVRKLASEGSEIAETARLSMPQSAPSPPSYSDYFRFRLCNRSNVQIAVAYSHRVSPTDGRFLVQGWWIIDRGECQTRTYPKGWFYFYGEQRNRGGKKFWGRNDHRLCVAYPGPFERINRAGYKCDRSRLKPFYSVFIEREQDEYVFNMTP